MPIAGVDMTWLRLVHERKLVRVSDQHAARVYL